MDASPPSPSPRTARIDPERGKRKESEGVPRGDIESLACTESASGRHVHGVRRGHTCRLLTGVSTLCRPLPWEVGADNRAHHRRERVE